MDTIALALLAAMTSTPIGPMEPVEATVVVIEVPVEIVEVIVEVPVEVIVEVPAVSDMTNLVCTLETTNSTYSQNVSLRTSEGWVTQPASAIVIKPMVDTHVVNFNVIYENRQMVDAEWLPSSTIDMFDDIDHRISRGGVQVTSQSTVYTGSKSYASSESLPMTHQYLAGRTSNKNLQLNIPNDLAKEIHATYWDERIYYEYGYTHDAGGYEILDTVTTFRTDFRYHGTCK